MLPVQWFSRGGDTQAPCPAAGPASLLPLPLSFSLFRLFSPSSAVGRIYSLSFFFGMCVFIGSDRSRCFLRDEVAVRLCTRRPEFSWCLAPRYTWPLSSSTRARLGVGSRN
jgi:hypothetical protein